MPADDDKTAPVRFYADDDARLPNTVASQLKLQLRKSVELVAGGYPADWGQYRQQVGFIKGLEAAIETCIEAEKEFTGS